MTQPRQEELRRGIVDKLAARKPESSICPSDVAREMGAADTWRDLMDPVRRAAADLVAAGIVFITQGDETVDLDTARGPIRIRRGPKWDERL